MDDFVAIPLQLGKVTLISPEDEGWVKQYKWTAKKSSYNWYAVRYKRQNGILKRFWLHREIMKPNDSQEVHHKHGHSLDNRRSELENCTRLQNLAYRKGGEKNAGSA